MNKDKVFEYLRTQEDIDPDSCDPSHAIMREAVRALKKVPREQIDVVDMDTLYMLSCGTWGSSVANKKSWVDKSHMLEPDKQRLKEALDRAIPDVLAGKYSHQSGNDVFGYFGRGFGTFARGGKAPYPKEHAQRFVGICCDIVDEDDPEKIYNIVEEGLRKNIRNLAKGSATQVLFLLKPTLFPVMNSWGAALLKQVLGTDLKMVLANYVEISRQLVQLRDKEFAFKNFMVIDQMPQDLEPGGGTTDPPDTGDDEDEIDDTPAGENEALNQILCGPPGTGKTYETPILAVAICDDKDVNVVRSKWTRDRVMKRYDELKEDGRIEFVTFHQSYGYEEFIEGLRPETSETSDSGDRRGGGGIRYVIRDGIFKRLCALAQGAEKQALRKSYRVAPGESQVWKMSLGNVQNPDEDRIYDECIERGLVLLGYGYGMDFTGLNSREAVFKKHHDELKGKDWSRYSIDAVQWFKNEMKVGDLVFVPYGNRKVRAIGRVTGEYEHPSDDEYGQRRSVDWLVEFPEPRPAELLIKKNFSQQTLYRLKNDYIRWDALNGLLTGEEDRSGQNHVLIVDEINRGNVSKIFGELITLIEPDKRLGQENGITVTLPYSGDRFGVPSNVFLIGTMNTADRSIALLDTALRRRFAFREIMPDPKLLTGQNESGMDLTSLLATINNRIEFLYDRDHQIGHSYFMGVQGLEDLRKVFLNKVIPLLQEYFYGDWGKICIVLGCPINSNGKASSANRFPLITAEDLADSSIPRSVRDDYEQRLRYAVNPEFKTATGELIQYFTGIYTPNNAKPASEPNDA